MYIIDTDAPAAPSRITPAEHQQWYLGYEAYIHGEPEPAHNEQAKGWRTAKSGAAFCTGIDLAVAAGCTLGEAEYDIYDEEHDLAQYGWMN